MGLENRSAEDLALYTDGQRIGTIRDLIPTPKERDAAMKRLMASLYATSSGRLPKQWNCKGRKRFIRDDFRCEKWQANK